MEFEEIYEVIKDKTMLDMKRCKLIYDLSQDTKSLNGNIIEVGVFLGGITKLLAMSNQNKTVYAFDSFSGMKGIERDPKIDTYFSDKAFSDLSKDDVFKFLDLPNIKIKKGIFPKTANKLNNLKISFCHFDADLYTSALSFIKFTFPKMVEESICVIDDYGRPECPGVKIAFDDFASANNIEIINLADYQAYFKKQGK